MRTSVATRSSCVLFAFALATVFASGAFASGADGTWHSVPIPAAPDLGPAFGHTIVFDALHERFVAFGGFTSGDTWTHAVDQPQAWSRLTTAGTPPAPRLFHSAVYDPIAHRMLVFGGNTDGSAAVQNDLWQLDFTTTPPTWSLVTTTGAIPTPHQTHSAVFDAARNRMVVYGGWTGAVAMDEVWILDCSTTPPGWQLVSIGGPAPAARGSHCGIFDAAQDRMVIFGGYGTPAGGGVGDLSDVWTLSMDPLAWTQVLGSSDPNVPFFAAAAYETLGHRMFVTNGELWSLDLDLFVWTYHGGSPGRDFAAFAIDPSGQHGVLHGGLGPFDTLSDTWLLHPVGTPFLSPGGPIANRVAAAAIYDPIRDRLLMLGGEYGILPLADISELQIGRDSSWVQVMASAPFGPRRGLGAVYDPVRDRVILFGGFNGTPLNDTWIVELSPSLTVVPAVVSGTPPSPRESFAAIYDPLRDRIVFHGGNSNGELGDVWALKLSPSMSWEAISPAPGPAPVPRHMHDAIYDPYADRMLVFGGFINGGATNDLWALSLGGTPTWTQLTPLGTPPLPRVGHSFEFDPHRHRGLLFGSNSTNDLWELKLGGQPLAWNQLSPDGTAPTRRSSHVGVFDPLHDRLLVSGGRDHQQRRDDVWRLQFANVPVATAMALLSSEVRSDEVVLKWGLSGDPATFARLERRDASTDWREIASGPTSGAFVTFRDRDVVTGARYAYRLVATGGAETSTSAEVWIDIPLGPRFSLAGFLPNPAQGAALRVAFSLSERTPATLEVVDVSGRRVMSERIESPDPGAQTILLAPEAELAPGLYFVKLTQGGRTLVARGSVMR